MADFKLSLVASFDEIVRNTSVLTTGIESEFLRFVTNQEICRKQWLQAEIDLQKTKRHLRDVEEENKALSTKLKHARAQIEHEMKKRVTVEQEKESLERQILLVRELLMDRNHQSMLNDKDREKLTFLTHDFQPSHIESPHRGGVNLSRIDESASLLSPSDISYDKTEEDLDASRLRSGRPWKRPSAPMMDEELSPNERKRQRSRSRDGKRKSKHRRSRSAHVIATTTVTVDGDKIAADSTVSDVKNNRRRSHKRHLTHSDAELKNLKNKANESDDSNIFKGTPNSSPTLRRINSAGKGLNRPHAFVNKTVIKPESCNHCGKRIKFSKIAAKCKDCRVTAHPDCKDMVPLPCIPTQPTPGTAKNVGGMLADYAPLDPPMVPALVIHCVNEVESRGLKEIGIYRVPGVESEVKGLKEKFLRGRGTPNLSNIGDINIVCGCIKDFLRNLKEPLVTYELWKDFVDAAENHDQETGTAQVYQAISMMPQPNRDTLAFLMLHLQRVAEAEECKMPAMNLARVFGPGVVGNSSAELEPMQMITETRKQAAVVEKLISISSDYWFTFMNIDTSSSGGHDPMYTPNTPESAVPQSTMLGPMTTPDSEAAHSEKKGSWFTPRFATKNRTINKKPTHFFSSPMLK